MTSEISNLIFAFGRVSLKLTIWSYIFIFKQFAKWWYSNIVDYIIFTHGMTSFQTHPQFSKRIKKTNPVQTVKIVVLNFTKYAVNIGKY